MKNLLLVAFLCMISIHLSAQDNPRRIGFGITVSGIISVEKGASGHGIDTKEHFKDVSAGITVEYRLSKIFSVESGAIYLPLAGSEESYDFYYHRTYIATSKAKYLLIPLTIKARTTSAGKLNGYADISYGAGFRIADSFEANNYAYVNTNFTAKYRSQVGFGGGAEFSVAGNMRIIAGYSYNLALSSLVKNDTERLNYSAIHLGLRF